MITTLLVIILIPIALVSLLFMLGVAVVVRHLLLAILLWAITVYVYFALDYGNGSIWWLIPFMAGNMAFVVFIDKMTGGRYLSPDIDDNNDQSKEQDR